MLLVALGLVLSACDSTATPVAARVNGSEISVPTLLGALRSIANNSAYRCLISQDSSSVAYSGTGSDTYAASFVSGVLSLLIDQRALRLSLRSDKSTTSSLAASVAKQTLIDQYSPSSGSACSATGQQVLSGFTSTYRNEAIQFQADEDTLAARSQGVVFDQKGLSVYAKAHLAQTSLACTAAILVASKARATALAIQINGGANFAAIAKANSLDQTSAASGGSLGCDLPGQFASPLDTIVAGLPVDKLSSPIAFNGSFVLILVTKREPAPLADVGELLLSSAAVTKAQSEVNAIANHASVSVDPAYGKWALMSGAHEVISPSGPPDRLLPNPKAVTPSASSSALAG